MGLERSERSRLGSSLAGSACRVRWPSRPPAPHSRAFRSCSRRSHGFALHLDPPPTSSAPGVARRGSQADVAPPQNRVRSSIGLRTRHRAAPHELLAGQFDRLGFRACLASNVGATERRGATKRNRSLRSSPRGDPPTLPETRSDPDSQAPRRVTTTSVTRDISRAGSRWHWARSTLFRGVVSLWVMIQSVSRVRGGVISMKRGRRWQ
jgi:hypothetical protein